MKIAPLATIIQCIANLIIIGGVFLALCQLKETKKATKAQVLMKLQEEWRNNEIYASMTYIHILRDSWYPTPFKEWHKKAREWVKQHNPEDREQWIKENTSLDDVKKWADQTGESYTDYPDKQEELLQRYRDFLGKKLSNEWTMRRTASQFLSKMGVLIDAGYFTDDEFFGVVPETGRLLAILIPIEYEIVQYFTEKSTQKHPQLPEWDRPFGKWEFNNLRKRYKTWYSKRSRSFEMKPLDPLDIL
jgi:arsenate reductase-like glutaredoxin family protein